MSTATVSPILEIDRLRVEFDTRAGVVHAVKSLFTGVRWSRVLHQIH